MADITRFNPFRSLRRFDPFDRDFDDLLKGFFVTPSHFGELASTHIPIDVSEDDKSYKVRAEIPGFGKDEIHVSINGDQVSINAESKKEKEEKKGDQVVLRECRYGRQYRSFILPQVVDDAQATAKYTDGVLELVLPKKAGTAQKKITID